MREARRGGGGVPGRVRAGAGAVRVARGAGAAAARAGEREPAEDGAGDRQHPPGAARRRRRRRRAGGRRAGRAAVVRLAEEHPHGRQVPAPRVLRRHQLRRRRQHRRAVRPPSRRRHGGARLVKRWTRQRDDHDMPVATRKLRELTPFYFFSILFREDILMNEMK